MKTKAKGFTLVEFMLALSITAIIGLCVASVSYGLSRAYGHNETYYENIQSGRFGVSYVQDTLRRTKLVTATSSTELLLWVGDPDCNGKISNSELVYWKFDSAAGQLKECVVKYPANLKAALDLTQPLSNLTTMSSASAILTSSAYAEWHVLADGVTTFGATVDQAAPKTTYVRIAMAIGQAPEAITLHASVAIRSDSTSLVKQTGGVWVLNAP